MDEGIGPFAFHGLDGVEDWRVVGDGAGAFFRTGSLEESAGFVQAVSEALGEGAAPAIDIRPGGVTVRLVTIREDYMGVTLGDAEVARRISAVARERGLVADPTAVQSVLVIVGATDPAAVMPFWRAVLGYEPRADSPEEDLVDPGDRGPAFWFEQMEEPRPDGGGAIHVAVWVPHDEAESRMRAALDAGGRLVRDDEAPAWWTIADAAGNEADVASVRGRDEPEER